MVNTSILALDLGTKTGWALSFNGTIFSGTENFATSRFSGGGMRFLRFRNWLDYIHDKTPVEGVFFEEVRRHLGVDAAHVYGGFLAHLSAWCEDHQIPYQGVSVGIIKKHATGKGNASKDEIISAMKMKGFDPKDDNEADALALLDFSLKNFSKNS